MRKNVYPIFLFVLVLAMGGSADAQCTAGRYVDEIFPSFTLDSVTYSTPYSLKMDIYQPEGDTLSARPLIIMAHEGTFISGDRESDGTCDSICQRFAKRGYVTASIDYRLTSVISMITPDSALAINEVMQAVSDGKAAIRYFMKDAATTNTYKIDTNNIFIGGNSAGAVLYMHVGYIDSPGACSAAIQTAMAANGGFEGNSGNPGYTTRFKAIIDLAGGLNETSFVGPGSKPSVNCQGSDDMVVPYTCGYPDFGIASAYVTLCGLGSLEPAYDAHDVYHMSHVFTGEFHVPWDTSATEFNTVDSIVKLFLYDMVCTNVASANTISTNAEVSLYPNPASDVLNITSSEIVSAVTVYDETGRIIYQAEHINKDDYEVNISRFERGIYFIKMSFSNPDKTPLIKRIVVE